MRAGVDPELKEVLLRQAGKNIAPTAVGSGRGWLVRVSVCGTPDANPGGTTLYPVVASDRALFEHTRIVRSAEQVSHFIAQPPLPR